MKKILLFISVLIVSIFTLNIRLFASNSYYLMSCVEQNIPTGYYDSVNTSSEAAMRESLYNIVSTGYIGGKYDAAWNIDSYADADPYNNAKVLCLYTGQSIDADNHGSYAGQWTREHVWCKSHGFNIDDQTNYPYNDCHHLRAAEMAINNHRSNSDFGEVSGLENVQSDEYGNKWTATIFEPRDEVKGDIARMLFYMAVRYGKYCPDYTYTTTSNNETTTHTVTYDLQLVDQDTTVASEGHGRLGNLSTLLKWHYQDPVSDTEIYRNNVVYQFQSNRNPFIDHPEYVDIAFQNSIGSYTAPAGKTPVEPDTVSRVEEVAQTIGFEESEGFTATSNYYGNQYVGPKDNKWGVFYGTPTKTSPLSGSQSMQFRWRTTNPSVNPQCFMMYDINNLSKVTFYAKGVANATIDVMYSLDEGVSWITNESLALTTSKKQYTSVISSNGGYGDVRIGFKVVLPSTAADKSAISVDDVTLYRAKDDCLLEFQKESTKANINFNYNESSVQKSVSYYQLVTDTASISVGDEIIIAPLAVDAKFCAMSVRGSTNNNYTSCTASVEDNIITSKDAVKIQIQEGYSEGTFALVLDNKYLGNQESGSNYLRPYDTLSDKTSFTIGIESTGQANLVIKDSTITKNTLGFNYSGSLFSCYGGLSNSVKAIAVYKKITETKSVPEYSYNETYLRFGGILTKSKYQDILAEDSNATFGIALSKDGSTYTPYECTVTLANLVEGKLVDNVNGDYAYFAVKVLTPKEHFNDTVYAKAYVIVNGETFYMQESSHSVTELVNYYLNNVTLTIDEQDLLGGLIQ